MELLKTVLLVPGVMAVLSLVTRKFSPLAADAAAVPIIPTTVEGPSQPDPTPDAGTPPSKPQLEECRQPELTIGSGPTGQQVDLMINEIFEQPEPRAQKDAIGGAEDREDCGDALVEEWIEWKTRCGLGATTYMVVSEWGNKVFGDLMQLVNFEITDGPKPFLRIDGLWPRVDRNPPEMDPYFEFKREVTLKSSQILAVQKVPVEIDMFDVEEFDVWQQKAKQLAGKFRSSTDLGQSTLPTRKTAKSYRTAAS